MATVSYTTTAGGLKLVAVCDHTQNISANISTVTVTLQLQHGEFYANALSGSYLSVAGNKTAYSKSISWSGGATTTTLSTKTVTVSHNADGTASCRIIGTFVLNGSYGSTSIGTMTVDQTLTLPTIPRSSGLTIASSANTGTSITATITPANSTFKHKLQYKVGATTFYTSDYIPAGTTTYTREIPHSWLPSADSGTLVVFLYTYNASGVEIASTYKLVSITVPASLQPSISSFAASLADGGLKGLFVQGKSSANLSVTASASAGSSIKSYTFSGPNIYTSTTANVVTTPIIQSKEAVTYKVIVTDYRNRSIEGTVNVYVYPYSIPTILSVTAHRCNSDGILSDNGTYIKYNINSSYSPVNGNNTRLITAAYSADGGKSYLNETIVHPETNTSSSISGVYGGGVFDITKGYILKFTIKDYYLSYPATEVRITSAARPINISKTGKGIGIGKMSENDVLLDCAWDIKSHGTFSSLEYSKLTGYTYLGSVDLNTIKTPGMYGVYNAANAPVAHISTLEVVMYSPDWIIQRLTSVETGAVYLRRWHSGTTWGSWYTALDDLTIKDFVVVQGTSGEWTIRKWNSGIAECWRTISGNITKYTTWNNMYGYTGSAQFPSDFFTQAPNVQYQVDIGTGFTMSAQGASSTKDKFNWLALASDGTENVSYKIDVFAIGKWK